MIVGCRHLVHSCHPRARDRSAARSVHDARAFVRAHNSQNQEDRQEMNAPTLCPMKLLVHDFSFRERDFVGAVAFECWIRKAQN